MNNLLRTFETAGCRFIAYGCESGNNRILQEIHKGIRIEDVVNAVNTTKKVGINKLLILL